MQDAGKTRKKMSQQPQNTSIALLQLQMEQNTKEHGELRKSIDDNSKITREGFEKLGNQVASLDNKYAPKSIEKEVEAVNSRVWAIVILTLTTVLGLSVWVYKLYLNIILEQAGK